MIRIIDDRYPAFVLETENTSYVMKLLPSGQLEHLYYGRKIHIGESIADVEALVEKRAFAAVNGNIYSQDFSSVSMEDVCLEVSGYGKGDIREPLIELEAADGSSTVDFAYDSYELKKGKEAFAELPGSYDENDEVDHLTVVHKDKNHGYTLELHYYVYEKCNVITRNVRFINTGSGPVRLNRLMSLLVDYNDSDYKVISFQGAWGREMSRNETLLGGGKYVGSSATGGSSNRNNPFFILSDLTTTEGRGTCYGYNLIYSGNHYEAVEISSQGKTRVVCGINPAMFSYDIPIGANFEAPEAVMTFSCDGYNGMSQNMHAFVRKHIVRGKWRDKDRPVLLNSWEAAYFNISEASLLRLAKAGRDAGIELFVMDDGWFGKRNDDKSSLGDWNVNTKKLPNGLKGLCDKVKAIGLDFGIWVEPEMVNVDSDLYRAHPDWAMEIPGMDHSEGRNQRILDLANPEVVDYMTEKMTEVFSSADISYVKWDMNRTMSDVYSPYLDAGHQGETAHRYILGLYRMLRTLNDRFPNILFEGCASGGNRFDLGMLCYFPQIWGSDNTDAVCRLDIQNGYSYGYPLSTVSAHVSNVPNHQTLRITPLESRFAVASFGILGYECNLCDMKKDDVEAIKAQIELYKKHRHDMQFGNFYRGRSGELYEWTVVGEDRTHAVGMIMQKAAKPNRPFERYFATGLKSDARYHFYSLEKKYSVKNFGDLVNAVSPVHIRQDSAAHNIIAKFVKMDGEKEDCLAYGDALMYAGVKLKQAFSSSGYSSEVRFFPDYGSRLYFMDEIEE